MALDEVGSGLLGIFELTDLSGRTGPLTFEKPSVRSGRALPGMLRRLQPGGTGLEVVAAAVPEEESAVRVLDTAAVLFMSSARRLENLVARSNGCLRPPPGAGAGVGKVLFERGLLFVDVSKLVDDVRRDAPDEFSVLGTKLGETLGGPGLVSGASRVAEALAAVTATEGLAELAHEVGAEAGYRRIGSISTALSLPVSYGLEPEPWRTLVDLDTTVLREHGWVDKTWGVAWPYPVSRLEAVVAS